MSTLSTSTDGRVMTVALHRPEARNAFNAAMIAELYETFTHLPDTLRAIVLTGAGSAFCAGADVHWMRDSIQRTEEENRQDAARMEAMFRAIDECPVPVIGRVMGPALGGGMGLIAACDIVIATPDAQFGYTEVRLGIVPAVISPFSLAKISERSARRYFLTGEIFDAATAHTIGLVHEVVMPDQLDGRVQAVVDTLLKNGPHAVRTAKELIRRVTRLSRDEAREYTIATIARARISAEGQDGLSAFLEKRKPRWLSE